MSSWEKRRPFPRRSTGEQQVRVHRGRKGPRNSDGTLRYQVRQMCRWLKVSVSGFYEWASRPVSATARWRAELGLIIEKLHADSDGAYGYRRIHAALARAGRHCHPDTVRSIMVERGLAGAQPRAKRRCTTRQAAQVAAIPDLVEQDFTSDTAGAKLVGDITYVPTAEGWLYLALVIDCWLFILQAGMTWSSPPAMRSMRSR